MRGGGKKSSGRRPGVTSLASERAIAERDLEVVRIAHGGVCRELSNVCNSLTAHSSPKVNAKSATNEGCEFQNDLSRFVVVRGAV